MNTQQNTTVGRSDASARLQTHFFAACRVHKQLRFHLDPHVVSKLRDKQHQNDQSADDRHDGTWTIASERDQVVSRRRGSTSAKKQKKKKKKKEKTKKDHIEHSAVS